MNDPAPRRRSRLLRAARNVLLWGLAALAVLATISVIRIQSHPVRALEREAPERTALMRQREREAKAKGKTLRIDRRWAGYDRISPTLRRAILIAEDDAFFSHDGLDWNEIQASAKKNLEKRQIVRGGSTITQQLAKNLYLGDARTLTRKLEEAFLAMRIERALTKRRIFELYLNEIEWGDGIFGAEAAARRHFGVPASQLSARQAVLLAAVIINPRRFSATHPNRRIERRARMIASRMRRRGFLNAEQYAAAIGQPLPKPSMFDWFFGGRDTTPPNPVPADPAPENVTEGSDAPSPAPAETDTTTPPDTVTTGATREFERTSHAIANASFARHAPERVEATPIEPLPDVLRAGDRVEIRWGNLSSDIEEMELLLSLDDGRHFVLRISPELDAGARRFVWEVPNLAVERARLGLRVGRETHAGSEHGERAASRHTETLLPPSAVFRIVMNPGAPRAEFALREGWIWIGEKEVERAAPIAAAVSTTGPSLIAARAAVDADTPPRAPLSPAPPERAVALDGARRADARAHAPLHLIPIRFVPLRN